MIGFAAGCQQEAASSAVLLAAEPEPQAAAVVTEEPAAVQNLAEPESPSPKPSDSVATGSGVPQQADQSGTGMSLQLLAHQVERLRFWDMYRRIRAEAARKKLDLSDEQEQQVAEIYVQAFQLNDHYTALATEIDQRIGFLQLPAVKGFLFHSIKRGDRLPSDLRTERVRVIRESLETVDKSVGELLPGIEEAIVTDSLTDAHLLDLIVILRERLADVVRVRKFETEQDKVFVYFNSYMLAQIAQPGENASPYYTDWRLGTIREHRAQYDAYGPIGGYPAGLTDEEINAELARIQTADVLVWTPQQMAEFESLAGKVEAMRGGPEPQLKFRKLDYEVDRSGVIRVSASLFAALQKADKAAFDQVAAATQRSKPKDEPKADTDVSFLELSKGLDELRPKRPAGAAATDTKFLSDPLGTLRAAQAQRAAGYGSGTGLSFIDRINQQHLDARNTSRVEAVRQYMAQFLPSLEAALKAEDGSR